MKQMYNVSQSMILLITNHQVPRGSEIRTHDPLVLSQAMNLWFDFDLNVAQAKAHKSDLDVSFEMKLPRNDLFSSRRPQADALR